jgi:hypothetical protein
MATYRKRVYGARINHKERPVMGTYDPRIAAHASLARIRAIIFHLEHKGLINNEEYTALLNTAIRGVADHEDGPTITALIKEIAQVP